jgi:hypothetical protein
MATVMAWSRSGPGGMSTSSSRTAPAAAAAIRGPGASGGAPISAATICAPSATASAIRAVRNAFSSGALGVAVVGSLLATRYQDAMTASLAGHHLPPAAVTAIQSSLGGALAVAAHAGGAAGQLLAHLARTAFVSGMDLGLFTVTTWFGPGKVRSRAYAAVTCVNALAGRRRRWPGRPGSSLFTGR